VIDVVGAVAGEDANCDGDLLDAADENDTISGFEIYETGSGNDNLYGSGATETFIPGDGDDFVDGNGGADWIDWSSSSAAMTIDVPNGTATGQGTDTFEDGVTRFVGSDFDDILLTDGNAPGPNVAEFFGGDGVDTVDASAETSGVFINLDILDPSGADDLENAIGSAFDDDLYGNDLRNVLTGGDGNDYLEGQEANDVFFGGLGNDVFNGGPGADTVDFGASPNGVVVDMSLGFASGEGDDSIAGIEIVRGSPFNDQITGGKTGLGSGINFYITGRAGNDILTGSDSNDYLKGGNGNDKMRGLEGGDTLVGGKGKKDKAWGGPGTDVCKSSEWEKSCEI
jgi:Ca2+-binding RTX toxin-like protein